MLIQKRYPGAGVPRAALTRGRSPPAHQVPGSSVPLWRAAGAPLPTRGWGCTRRSGPWPEPPLPTGDRGRACQSSPCPPAARDARAALARGWSPPDEKTDFVKRQPKVYLFDIKCQPKLYLVDV